MNTCKTCVHWQPVDPADHKYDGPELLAGGYCQSEMLAEEEPHGPDMLVYSYSEGGRFWTGPEFGCVHHKGKP